MAKQDTLSTINTKTGPAKMTPTQAKAMAAKLRSEAAAYQAASKVEENGEILDAAISGQDNGRDVLIIRVALIRHEKARHSFVPEGRADQKTRDTYKRSNNRGTWGFWVPTGEKRTVFCNARVTDIVLPDGTELPPVSVYSATGAE